MADESEFHDHVIGFIASAIQTASADFPHAARRDFPIETDGRTSLTAYLRSNQVSRYLAEAVFAELQDRGFRISAERPQWVDSGH